MTCERDSHVWPMKYISKLTEPATMFLEYCTCVRAKQKAARAMHQKQSCAESADDHGRILEKILTDFEHDPWMEIPETPNEYNVVIRKGTVSTFVESRAFGSMRIASELQHDLLHRKHCPKF